MTQKRAFQDTYLNLVSICLALIFTSACSADIVIGNWESSDSNDGWSSWPEDPNAILTPASTIGVTLGSGSLRFTPVNDMAYWRLKWEGAPLNVTGAQLKFDMTIVGSEWPSQPWTKVADKIAINSDGPSGWKEWSNLATAINRDTGEPTSLDWGAWAGDANKTYTLNVSDYNATGATWMQIIISVQVGNVLDGGHFYFDNIRLLKNNADLNGDGVVDWLDFEILVSHWLETTDSNSVTWMWVNGPNTPNQDVVYGIKGVADPNNQPGGRDSSGSWIDSNGNLWLFGGYSAHGFLNDLWKCNQSSGLWTWVSGSSEVDQLGVYGTNRVAGLNNMPGARANMVSWIDANGNFWLFGGYGYDSIGGFEGELNDLWKYNPSSGFWTWVSGYNLTDQPGIYGNRGVAAPDNMPGGRDSCVSWIDSNDNLWLFGGWDLEGYLNDLWKYDPSSGLWMWVSGSSDVDQLGVYGTKGVAESNNIPGARANMVSWIDANGNFWLFGGYGYDADGNEGKLNDLWKYNPSSGFWTWVSGSNLADQPGVYGTKGVAAPDNMPGGRDSCVPWIDSNDNLWLFGGKRYDETDGLGYFNDLWRFDGTNWTWVSGFSLTNQLGVYGTKGVADSDNVPGSRGYSVSWIDGSGNFWFFGGYGYDANGNDGELSDLWKFGKSKTPGDLNGNGIINFGDFAVLVYKWSAASLPVPPIGDFTGDFKVDFADFYYFAARWLSICSAPDWCNGTDFDQSGLVDFADFSIFAQHWLEGVGS